MGPQPKAYLELLERRVATLRLLLAGLQESQEAYVELNLDAIQQHIAHQENLCAEIRLLDAELSNLKSKLGGGNGSDGQAAEFEAVMAQLDPASARHLQLLLRGLATIQADVRRLCRVHSELLRRSRRSVNVLLNFLANCAGTYRPPQTSQRLTSPVEVRK